MKHRSRPALVVLIAAGTALALAACGGGSSGAKGSPSSAQESSLVQNTTAKPQASGAFGSTVTLPSGVAVTLTNQAVFQTTKFSSGQIDGQKFNSFDITVKNGTTSSLDLGTLILTATAGAAGSCVDIFDGQVGIQGAPTDPVAAGASATFKWALSCPGKAGDPLDITMTTDGTTNVQVIGKLI